ncbi:unnamed protein product [Moneuplotes crassus]|uniref:Uncharacterized protein n=1 Tax=Euplotes crassus TaxID=5936 RepID=A0AAD2D1M2_EUPCR|nr:unnamed protein product [Moneuplotes crassus]
MGYISCKNIRLTAQKYHKIFPQTCDARLVTKPLVMSNHSVLSYKNNVSARKTALKPLDL